MSRIIIAVLVVVAVIFSAPFCFAQEQATTAGDSLATLQKEISGVKESTGRIEKDIQGLKASGVETQKKIGQVEENLGRKIDDSKTEIQKNLSQTLGDSLQKVEKNLGQKIDDSTAKTEEKLGQISGGVKKIFCLIFALAIVSVLVIVVITVQKRRDKKIWLTVEFEANGAAKVYEVLTRYSPRNGVYTSPFKTRSGAGIDRNTSDAMIAHYRNALKKVLEDTTSEFAVQMEALIKGGKIKEIK